MNEWSTTPKQGNKSTHSRYGHKMFNKISVKDQLEQSPHSTKDAEAKASLHRLLPDLLSIFSNSPLNVLPPHSTPDCHPLPGWERLPNTATVGSPGSSNTATKRLAFPDTPGPEQCGSSKPPSQVPVLKKRERERPPRLTTFV